MHGTNKLIGKVVVLWVIGSPRRRFVNFDSDAELFLAKRTGRAVCSFAVTNEDLKGFPTKHVKIHAIHYY